MYRTNLLITILILPTLSFSSKLNKGWGYVAAGEQAYEGQFPYQVSISIDLPDNIVKYCGGSILTKYWIVTAAHCVEPSDIGVKDVLVLAGSLVGLRYFDSDVDSGQLRTVSKIIIHASYKEKDEDYDVLNDIALLKLTKPLDFDDPYVDRIYILNDDGGDVFDDDDIVTVSGWGWDELGKFPKYLLYSDQIRVVRDGYCKKRMLYSQICAASTKAEGYNADACGGDSGGPLTIRGAGKHSKHARLLGIVSVGDECPSYGFKPGVYTYVPDFFDWINRQIEEE